MPAGLSLNSTTGLISGTVGLGSFGSSPYQVTVKATDSGKTSSQSFVWTVTPRVALTNPGPRGNAVGDSVSVQLSATSPGGTMSYSATGLPPGLSISSGTGLISGTPTTASATPYTVTVTANDGTSSSSQTFAWTVSTIWITPPANQTNLDGDTVSLPLTTAYHGTGTLSYTATGLPAGLSISSTTGQITGTLANTDDTNSPYSVTVTATDGTSTASQTFTWTVNPRVSIDPIGDQSNAVGDTVSLQVTASDALNSTLSYSATGLPAGLTIAGTTGLITGTIALGADASSPYTVTVTVTDSAGVSSTQTFHWTVAHVSLVNPGSQGSVDGRVVSLQMQGSDADHDTLSWTASGLPSGLSINSSTGLISGTLATNADGNSPYDVTVTASDGTHSTSQTFLWTVSQVALTAPANQTNTEGDTVSLQLQGLASSGSLTYSASGLPAGLSLNSTTGLISGTIAPGGAANGPFTVDVSASNGTVSVSQTFTWTVNPVVALAAVADQSNVEGNNVSLQLSATDSKHASLTYTAAGLPSGLSISSTTGLITGTVTTGDSSGSPYAVTVTASDGTYSTSQTFNWTITHVDTTVPTLTNPGTQDNVAGDSVGLALAASDPDGDALTFSATGLPDGLEIDTISGAITGTLTSDAISPTPYVVTVTAADGNGQSASQTFDWIVNDAAIQVQGTPLTATEGTDTGDVTVATFTDPNPGRAESDYVATVNWGDGNSDTGIVSGDSGAFTVYDDHTYAHPGSYTVQVSIDDGYGETVSTTTTATVAAAPLTATGGFVDYAVQGQVPTENLAIFTDANPGDLASSYTALINWGDGTNSPGTVAGGNGQFSVSGSHAYASDGAHSATVTITDADNTQASATSTVQVGDLFTGEVSNLTAASFTDSDGNVQPSAYTATIHWGDGTQSSGTVAGSGGVFSVQGNHTYAVDSLKQPGGVYQVSVSITDSDGDTLMGNGTVTVVRSPVTLDVSNVIESASGAVNNAVVAAFTDPNPNDSASQYSATINWGDNTSSAATSITQTGGIFQVLGSHTYAQAQVEPVTVSLYWLDPVEQGAGQAQAAPPAAPAAADNLSAAVRNVLRKYGKDGALTLGTIDKLMGGPTVQGSDAVAVAILKGYVLDQHQEGEAIKPASYANLFVQNLDRWSPVLNGITADNVTYFENNLKDGARLQAAAKVLNGGFQAYLQQLKATNREKLFAQKADWEPGSARKGLAWRTISQGAVGDCAFLSVTIGLVAQDPVKFKEGRITEKGLPKDGIQQYEVSFGDLNVFGSGPIEVVPAPTDAQIALYASAGAGGLWLSVWEKAYVQAYKAQKPFGWLDFTTYDSLKYGEPLKDAMKRVTGHSATVYNLTRSGLADPMKKVEIAWNKATTKKPQPIMTFDVNDKGAIATALGIKTAHAFGIVSASGAADHGALAQKPWNKTVVPPPRVNYGRLFNSSLGQIYAEARYLVIEDR